jgi:hypothetical protein
MLRKICLVLVVVGLALVSLPAFADGLGATEPFLFPGGGTYTQGGSSTLIRATPPAPVLATSLLSAPLTTPTPKPCAAAVPCAVPENWSVSDWLGFSVLALLTFGLLIRLRVLQPFVR